MSAPDVSIWRGRALLMVGLSLQGETFDWKRAGTRTGLNDEETQAAIGWLRDQKYVRDASADAVTITPAGLVYAWRAPDADTWRARRLLNWGLSQGDTFDWKRAGLDEGSLTEREAEAAYEWLRDRKYVEDAGTHLVSVTSAGQDFSRPAYFPETPLPTSPDAVIGEWLCDFPMGRVTDRCVIRPVLYWTLSGDGTALLHTENGFTVDGMFRPPLPTKDYPGTWTIENDTLVVHLPTGPGNVPRKRYTLIRILLGGGETRECLKGIPHGDLYWRVEAE